MKTTEQDDAYNALALQKDVRDVDLPPGDEPEDGVSKSFSQMEEEYSDATDMQAVLFRLFPKQQSREENLAMVSRIHPDVFLPFIDILATSEVMRQPDNANIDVAAIRLRTYALLSIGLDGRGRIDALELGGAARDSKNTEKQFGRDLI
jgi:hypothetical protein